MTIEQATEGAAISNRPHSWEYEGNPVSFLLDASQVWVNATQMARPFGKMPTDYTRSERTRELISALSDDMGFPIAPEFKENRHLVRVVNGNGGGTWLHRELALDFARWLSPKFAIWCDRKIRELLETGKTQIAVPKTLPEALRLAAKAIEEKEAAEAKLALAAPKVEAFEDLISTQGAMLIRDAVKVIPGAPGQFKTYEMLRDLGVIMPHSTEPYQKYVDDGYFIRRTRAVGADKGRMAVTTYVTPKGLDFLRKRLGEQACA